MGRNGLSQGLLSSPGYMTDWGKSEQSVVFATASSWSHVDQVWIGATSLLELRPWAGRCLVFSFDISPPLLKWGQFVVRAVIP